MFIPKTLDHYPHPHLQVLSLYYQEMLALCDEPFPTFTRDVWPEFALALLTQPNLGPGMQGDATYKKAVRLYQDWLKTGLKPSDTRWKNAHRSTITACNQFPLLDIHAVFPKAQNAAYAALYAAENDTSSTANYAAKAHNDPLQIVLRRQYDAYCALQHPVSVSIPVDL